ncbi:splicing factor 3B subunit 1-like [Dorcoceras hygrometricum]|uniref:Splicing factor 3B subunit 1-like n=1 Tax=Dorcoceras hygrometricum TaxID=472368 RepID=A0A2Z7B2R6_9LAMI|nr:splicing factor 3B subunit 1-like [Dorcoceras hygrometricum]
MASSLINNSIQVYFDSVLEMEHEGMVAMFEALLLSGLSGFLGCSSAIYEAALVEFFHNASVMDEQQREKTTVDDVDKIIDQVIFETEQMETDMEEPSLTRSDNIVVEDTERSTAVNDEDDNLYGAENEIARKMTYFTAPKQFLKEPLRSGEDDDMSGLNKVLELPDKYKSDEESMSIEDILKQIPAGMMLPSVIAAEITRIKFGLGIEIPEVNEGDWYKASIPRIATSDKGKVPVVAEDEIKGNPVSGPVLINKDYSTTKHIITEA